MRAVSYAALPLRRYSRVSDVDNDSRSVAGTVVSLRSVRSRTGRSSLGDTTSKKKNVNKPLRSFETIFQNISEYIQSVFVSEKEQHAINRLLQATYNTGLTLCNNGPTSYTEDDVKHFFHLWGEFASELSSYFQIPADDRLIQFVDDTVTNLTEIVKPLILPDSDDDPLWSTDHAAFDDGLKALKTCFTPDVIDITTAQRIVNDLLNQADSSTNAFFRNRHDIVFQCRYRFTRLIDSFFEYIEDEPQARKAVSELNSITTELRGIFTPKKEETNYVEMLTKRELKSRERRKSDFPRFPKHSFIDQEQTHPRPAQVHRPSQKALDATGIPHEKSLTNYAEKFDKLTIEVTELRKEHHCLRESIKEYMARKSLTLDVIAELRHRQYVAVHHENMLMNDTIKLLREHFATLEKDLKSWRSINSELQEGSETQTIAFSNDKLRSEVRELRSELAKASGDLQFLMNQRGKIVDVNWKGGLRDDYMLGLRYLCLESAGYKQMHAEAESLVLEFRKLINNNEKTVLPKQRSPQTTRQLRQLLADRRASLNQLRQKCKRRKEEVVSLPVLSEVPPELAAAHERLKESRVRRERMIEYALSVENDCDIVSLEADRKQLESIQMEKALRKAGIPAETVQSTAEKLSRNQKQALKLETGLKYLRRLFDVSIPSSNRKHLTLSQQITHLRRLCEHSANSNHMSVFN